MADPLTLIGLASNIIAFIDFGVKLVSAVKSIQDSAEGTLPEISDLGLIVNSIRTANANLKLEISSQSYISRQDESVSAMATECVQIADQLGSLIGELKLRDTNNHHLPKGVEASRLYVRAWRKKKPIDSLRHRLEILDGRISKSVKLSLQGELGSTIKAHLHAFQKLQLELDSKYESRLDGIQGMIEQLKEQEYRTEVRQLRDLQDQLHLLKEERYNCQRQYDIIQSLYFPELRRRWSKIPYAERGTNDWLFDRSKTTFVDWLESKDGIYWISGRAGSGKSTLMKFACEHKATLRALKTWSSSRQLYTASYYFWNQGFEMQKSQIGLLQSLLYQILRCSPSLVLDMCPDRPAHERWEVEDLKEAYQWIAKQEHLPARYCFFIDGLDEYDGDEEEAVKILSFLRISRHIKLCVSSRPRTIFEDALRDSRYTFAIQDYTNDDMKTYVQKQLDSSFGDTRSSCSDLTTQISEQAQGVWLWVFLITRDLERAIRRKEGIPTLQRLVREFPPDLEAYFEHIISRIDRRYKREMAQIFLVAIEEVQPLPLFAFSLLERENTMPDYALEAEISPLDDKTSQVEGLWDRIQARCSDLLVIDDIPHPTFLDRPVDFLHRTVRDYLQDCYYQQLRSLAQGFNPLISLCKITLYMLKRIPEPDLKNKKSRSIHIRLVDELLYYAHEDEKKDQSSESSLVDILDELDRVSNCYARHIRNHWTHARDPPMTNSLDEYHEGGNCSFLALAIQARLTKYVRAKVQSDRSLMTKKQGRPLLDYALRPLRLTPITMPYHSQREDPSVDVKMVQLLLQYGGNPNQPVFLNNDHTVWVLFLISCHEYTSKDMPSASLRNAWCQAAELLIKQGARPDQSFGKHLGHLSAQEILETRIFGPQKAAYLDKIMKEAQMRQSTESSSWLPKAVKGNLKRVLWWQRA